MVGGRTPRAWLMWRPGMDAGGALPFADLLKRHRVAAGLTQEQLAERAGLSVRGLSNLERGERRLPQHATVRLLADALRLDEATRAAFVATARGWSFPAA